MGGTGQKDRLPRGVSIRRLDSGERLQIAFTFNGKNHRELLKLEPTKANIRAAAGLRAEIVRRIDLGTFVYHDYFPKSRVAKKLANPASKVTVAEMLDDYIGGCERALANGSLSLSTLDGYRKAVRHHLKPGLGDIALADLDAPRIREFVKGMSLSAKSIMNTLIPLRQMLEDALNDDLIAVNPMDKVALRRLVTRVAKKTTYTVDPFTPDEVRAIVSAATGQAQNFIRFAFATGLRTSELIALRWEDVDIAGKAIRVAVALVEQVEKGPKTKAGRRTVELAAEAVQALEAQRAWTLLMGGRVFYNPKTGRPLLDDQAVRKCIWLPAIKASGVRYRNPYQTRHTFASTHLSQGANPWWVAQQMGHETVEMLWKHYGRWIPQANERPARLRDA